MMRHATMATILLSLYYMSAHSAAAETTPMPSATTATTAAALQPVPFTKVKISDKFWHPRLETNRTVSIPHSIQMLKNAGNISNLELAAAGAREGYQGPCYIDSDLYKALEAVSYSLASVPDPDLENQLDEIIVKIAAAQQRDGYLNTWVQVTCPDKRWANLRDKHELYCAGHLIEAAVAHHAATGKTTLLDVAIKFADYIDSVFGDEPGKRMGYPGHQELELALFKLWKTTGEQRYYDLAQFFMEKRGTGFFAKEHGVPLEEYNGEYWMDNALLRNHRKIVGHAVRSVYYLSAATDYAAESKDEGVLEMIHRVWNNTTGANMYVTGGIGSSAANEGFTEDFDLPNFTGYQETCASVAMIMWNHRLGLLTGDSKYADFMERALYNGFLSGVALDGKKYFYVNPLASHGHHHRKDWYSCACCPPNVTRTLAQLGGYAYATSPGNLFVNLYIQGSVAADLGNTKVDLEVQTDYPWSGDILLNPNVTTPTQFALRLRIPGWCEGETVTVNNQPVNDPALDQGYLVLDRTWAPGDEVHLKLPMPVTRVAADPRVKANTGRLAIQRGPVVYCLEGCDHDAPVHNIALPRDAQLAADPRPDQLGGIVRLTGQGKILASPDKQEDRQLYAPAPDEQTVNVSAIPYYAWDNREPGAMAVWLPLAPPAPPATGLAGKAKVTMSFAHNNCTPEAANDGLEPVKSSDLPPQNCHWWPHKGTEEWVQYEWRKPQKLSSSRIFWFDDTGRGECRLPHSWRLEYKDGDHWKAVETKGDYTAQPDQWNEIEFTPMETTALRAVVKLQPNFSAGVLEWQVEP